MAEVDFNCKIHKTFWFYAALIIPRILLRFHPKAVVCVYYLADNKYKITISEAIK